MRKIRLFFVSFVLLLVMVLVGRVPQVLAGGQDPYGNEDPNKKVLKQGLMGAATGAIASEASGGKAGTGALVGAGTNVIGTALIDTLTTPAPQAAAPQPVYAQPAPVYSQSQPVSYAQPAPQQRGYYQDPPQQPVYYAAPPPPPQQNPSQNILKQGLMGAATGAIASSASGGKAGKGALIGAGTSVIGNALLDTLTTPSQPRQQPVYYQPQPQQQYYPQQQQQPAGTKKIIRKYDAEGNIIQEEEVYE